MKYKRVIIVSGEPNSVFLEIFLKIIKKKFKSPIILICSKNILNKQAKILGENIKFNEIDINKLFFKKSFR